MPFASASKTPVAIQIKLNNDLSAAARNGSVGGLEKALIKGADPLAALGGETPLIAAARYGRIECLKILLPLSDPLASNNQGFTALQFAALMGDAAAVELLLPVSDIARGERDGITPLMHAVRKNQLDCVRILSVAADPAQTDSDGRTALTHAAMALEIGQPNTAQSDACAQIMALLVERAGPSVVNAADKNGRTPFATALAHEKKHNALALIPSTDLNAKDPLGFDAFALAFRMLSVGTNDTGRVVLEALCSDPRATEEQVNRVVHGFSAKERFEMPQAVARFEAFAIQRELAANALPSGQKPARRAARSL